MRCADEGRRRYGDRHNAFHPWKTETVERHKQEFVKERSAGRVAFEKQYAVAKGRFPEMPDLATISPDSNTAQVELKDGSFVIVTGNGISHI
jgi:hypothetical protein